jgi:hypothetical protein
MRYDGTRATVRAHFYPNEQEIQVGAVALGYHFFCGHQVSP